MPLDNRQFIDQLLNHIDIVDVVSARIPKAKRVGRNLKACCPFHDEKTPSFSVNADKQFYYCFGCRASGDAISFVSQYDKLEFVDALSLLAEQCGLEVPSFSGAVNQQKKIAGDNLFKINKSVVEMYKKALNESVHAKEYLKSRGLSDATLEKFDIGYAPDVWTHVASLDIDKKTLIKSGLVIEHAEKKSLYDRFRDRVMFPILDTRSRVVGFGGRLIKDSEAAKYINSPETDIFRKKSEIYGLQQCLQCKDLENIFVAEGYMDVVALSEAGIENSVATLGTAIGEQHIVRLFKYTNRIVFCFDGDTAGRSAAEKALSVCMPYLIEGRDISFIMLPQGEDPDSIVKKSGKDGFIQLPRIPISDFLMQVSWGKEEKRGDAQTATCVGRALDLVKHIPTDSAWSIILKNRIAEEVGMSLDNIHTLARSQTKPVSHHNIHTEYKTNGLYQVIALLISAPSMIDIVEEYKDYFSSYDTYHILEDILRILAQSENITTPSVLGLLSAHTSHMEFVERILQEEIVLCQTNLKDDNLLFILKRAKLSALKQRLRSVSMASSTEELAYKREIRSQIDSLNREL